MNAKEYLSQAFHIDQRIDSKLAQVMRLRESATKCTQTISDMPRASSPNLQTLESTICKIVDLENEINADIDKLVDLKAEARRVINAVADPDQQLILELRYLSYKNWEEIAEELGYGMTWIHKLHGRALANVIVPTATPTQDEILLPESPQDE